MGASAVGTKRTLGKPGTHVRRPQSGSLAERQTVAQNGTVAFAPTAFSWIVSPKRPS